MTTSDPVRYGGCLITHHIEQTDEELLDHPGRLAYLLVHFEIEREERDGFAVDYRIPLEVAGAPPLLLDPGTDTPEAVALRKGMAAVRFVIDADEAQPGELLEIVWLR